MTDMFKKACLCQIQSSCWTGSKTLNTSIMDNLGNGEWLRGRKLLISQDLLGPIRTTIHQARKLLARYALPFPMAGLHLVPKESLVNIDGQLDLMKAEFFDKVETFAGYYSQAREEARQALGELFNESDYPIDIRNKFRFEWRFLQIDVPGRTSVLSPEIYTREKEKFLGLMNETRELAMAALREEFGEIVHHLTQKIISDDKPKVFRINMVTRINEYLDAFQDRNIFNDTKLEALVEEARGLVRQISGNPYGVQYNDVLRQKFTKDFNMLKASIDAAIEEMPRRRIHLDVADRGVLLPDAA